MSSNSEILTNVSMEGCILPEHHRETVASSYRLQFSDVIRKVTNKI